MSTELNTLLSFSDDQLQLVMAAVGQLPEQKRGAFLQLLDRQLRPRTIDLESAVERALRAIQDVGT
jgi:hypothetical protein